MKVRIPKQLDYDDVSKIGKAMTCERNKIMFMLTYFCGLRLGELMKIRSKDFNWKTFITKGRKGMGELLVKGKGDKEGIAIVPEWIMKRAENWLNTQAQIKLINKEEPIFGISERNWQGIVKK